MRKLPLQTIGQKRSGYRQRRTDRNAPLQLHHQQQRLPRNTIGAEALPYPSHLATFGSANYVIIEKVKVGIRYKGEECALGGILVSVTGSAGGEVNNTTETATFNSTTLSASKTELKALSQKIEWSGVFPTEAFQWHREQALSVS